jgi:hypothetical protein
MKHTTAWLPLLLRDNWIVPLLICLVCAGSLRADVPLPGPGETNIVLETWSFDKSTNGPWASDSGHAPLSFTNLSSSDLGRGSALVVDSTNEAWVRYNCNESDGHTNITVSRGTVMMWFASTSWASTNEPGGTGPGTWARLLEIGEYTTNASYGWFSLYLDPAGANVYFSSQTNNGSQATYFSAPVDFKTNRWHHLAVTYDSTNCDLYVDGELVTNGLPIAYWPGSGVVTNGFTIGSDTSGLLEAHGMFDDVATYAYPLDAQAVAGEFFAGEVYFLLNPMNAANLTQAPSEPVTTPVFEAITGSGFLTPIATNATCVSSSNVWMTNVSAAFANNATMNLTFTIAGGSNGCVYDVFATPALEYPLTNGQWYWMGQGSHCVTYTVTNLPSHSAMFLLGQPTDSDGDGLTDAYELLVSHTDPQNPDTLGLGMSDGWQIAYGYYGADPFSEPFNNGWTLLDEFLNGLDPTIYNQPPAPQGLAASFVNSTATVNWNPSSGAVTGYKLEKYDPAVYPATTNDVFLSASTNEYLDAGQEVPDNDLEDGPPIYRLQAIYGTHSSAWSAWVPLYNPDPVQFWGSGYLAPGPQGQIFVTIPAPPQQAQSVRIVFANAWPSNQTWVVPLSSFTNNAYLLPPASLPEVVSDGNWFAELRDAATNLLGTVKLVYYGYDYYPFYDGRRQLQQNLSFLLRAAGANSPFEFTLNDGSTVLYSCPVDHAVASFVELFYDDPPNITPTLDVFTPFRNNYFLRNFAFTTNDLNANGTLDSVSGYTAGIGPEIVDPPLYNFPAPTNGTQIDPILAPTDFPWTFFRPAYTTDMTLLSGADIGYGGGGFTLPNSGVNLFGLAFQSVQMAYETNGTLDPELVSRPATVPDYGNNLFYPSTAAPVLVTTNYYFGAPFIDPLPGDGVFAVTNSTPTLIAGIGRPYWLAGYAKQAIINGNSSKFGFLGQYFAGAYLIDTNGVVTTNQTGILSEYGEFFPTQPGPTALVTMTNWGVNERGTAVVNVITLCVDANHDGTIDTTYWGPDATSFLRPFRFWLNNDCDGTGVGKDTQVFPNSTVVDSQQGYIRSWRNLEDFARLWVCGLPKLPPDQGYRATLSMSASSGTPSINLYPAFTNSADYLSSTNAAAAQFTQYYLNGQLVFDYSKKLGTVNPSQSYNLPLSADGIPLYTNFLFEGAGTNGSGQLTLTISQTTVQGSNVLAQTSMWLDLHDVKDFYERAVITNNISGAKSNWTSGIEIVQPATASALGDDTNLIVLVHGINVPYPDWGIEGDTVLKRLYWAGYRGKFAAVKWPCEFFSAWTALTLDTSVFNRSEMKAYKAGLALKAYLSQLRDRFPGYRIHLLVHSQGNSVASEAIEAGATFDTYILTQGALPASSYDVNAPTNAVLLAQEATAPAPEWQPMGYRGVYTNMTGRIVNFFNTNDPVLRVWLEDQGEGKPDGFFKHVLWEATHSIIPPPAPWYDFDGTNGWYNTVAGFGSYRVTDPQESRAYVSRSHTEPIGRSPPETQHGVIRSGVDLNLRYGFNNAFPDDHSAQWVWPIQTTLPYYLQVLESIKP